MVVAIVDSRSGIEAKVREEGLTVMPGLAVPPGGLPRLAARPLLPRLERTVMLVRRHDRALSPVAERVWRIVSATVRAGVR